MKWTEIAILPLVAVLLAILFVASRLEPGNAGESGGANIHHEKIPNFSVYRDVSRKKKTFFEFMLPKVRRANAIVSAERKVASDLSIKVALGKNLSDAEAKRLSDLLQKYRVKEAQTENNKLQELLARVDTVPASLILAQSATESAWGTSRFARQGNNFFGIWCFTPGCGLTPKYRDEGLTHEVAVFDTVQDSVDNYLLTLNTNLAYKDLRAIRAHQRRANKQVKGTALAEGLRHYSERGSTYVRQIQHMIKSNNLQKFTEPALQVTTTD